MRYVLAGLLLLGATPALAACPNAIAGTGTARTLDPQNKADIDLLLSASMMPKLMHLDYAHEAALTLPCRLATFDVAPAHYEVRAADPGKGTGRIALPDRKGLPLAELIPVANIFEALGAAKKGNVAPVSAYMLVTISEAEVTGWRIYTGVPPTSVLVQDMAAALSGGLRPMFRNHPDGKSDLFVPQPNPQLREPGASGN